MHKSKNYTQHRTVLIIFLIIQTVVTAQTMSTGGEGMQHNICKVRMCEKRLAGSYCTYVK